MMGASQLDRYGNQNISCIGDWAPAELAAARRARRAGQHRQPPTSYWVPRHSPRVFVERVDMVCGVGYDRAAALGSPANRSTSSAWWSPTWPCWTSRPPDRSMRLRSVHPGVSVRGGRRGHRLPAGRPGRGAGDPAAHRRRARADPRPPRPAGRAGPGGAMSDAASPSCSAAGTRSCRPAWGTWPAPRLAAATSAAGGLGIIASATMSLDRARARRSGRCGSAPTRRSGSTCAPTPPTPPSGSTCSSRERVRLASFALAPEPRPDRPLRDAGVVTMPSVGARRHAEKVGRLGRGRRASCRAARAAGTPARCRPSLLLPQVVDAVDIPVVAAGGFFDGRGLVAALAYGAAGIAMGTRFLLTSDSPVGDAVKQALPGRHVTDTVVTTRVDGVPHRVLRTPFVDALERAGRLGGPGTRGSARGRLPPGVRAVLAGAAAGRPGAAARPGADLGADADGGQHPGAAAGRHGGRPARPRRDVGRPGGRAHRRPAVLRGAHRAGSWQRPSALGRLAGSLRAEPAHSRSMIVTFAWPPPSHMVSSP